MASNDVGLNESTGKESPNDNSEKSEPMRPKNSLLCEVSLDQGMQMLVVVPWALRTDRILGWCASANI